MVQSPWLKTDPQQNFHQIALNNSLLQPNLLNGLPQRYVLSQCSIMPRSPRIKFHYSYGRYVLLTTSIHIKATIGNILNSLCGIHRA